MMCAVYGMNLQIEEDEKKKKPICDPTPERFQQSQNEEAPSLCTYPPIRKKRTRFGCPTNKPSTTVDIQKSKKSTTSP